jgi:hypothetical protein
MKRREIYNEASHGYVPLAQNPIEKRQGKGLDSSTLCQLLQFPLLLPTQRLIQAIEIRNVLPPRPNEELGQISLRLVISLSHETSLTFTVGHEFCFCGSETEVKGGRDVLPAVIVAFFVCVLGCCLGGGGGVGYSRGGEELFDENFEDF